LSGIFLKVGVKILSDYRSPKEARKTGENPSHAIYGSYIEARTSNGEENEFL